LDGELILLRLVQLDDQQAVGRTGHRLRRIPGQHLIAAHANNFPRAVQPQRDAIQLALHHFEMEQRHFPHQAGAEADLRQHLR
jgi:hypothetical protein